MPHKKCCCCCMEPVKGLVVTYTIFLALSYLGTYQYTPAPFGATFRATFTNYGVPQYTALCSNSSADNYCALLCEKDGTPFEYETFTDSQKTIGFARFATYVAFTVGGNTIGLIGAIVASKRPTVARHIITVAIGAAIIQPLNTVAFFALGFPSADDSLRSFQIVVLNRYLTGVDDCNEAGRRSCPVCTTEWIDGMGIVRIFGLLSGIAAIVFSCLVSGFVIYNSWIVVRLLKNPDETVAMEVPQHVVPVAQTPQVVAQVTPAVDAKVEPQHVVPIAQETPLVVAQVTPAVDAKVEA